MAIVFGFKFSNSTFPPSPPPIPGFDALVFVTPEYNHGIAGTLKMLSISFFCWYSALTSASKRVRVCYARDWP